MTYALVEISNIYAPETLDEGYVLDIDFDAESSTSEINYSIYVDGQLLSEDKNYSAFMNYSTSGTYDFTFLARDNESEAVSNKIITINDVPLSIEILSPENKVYNQRTINISVTVNRDDTQCKYSSNDAQNGTLDFDDTSNIFLKSIIFSSDGAYEISVTCYDLYDSTTKKINFIIDTINLFILTKSYSIDNDYVVTLNAETYQKSTCRYDSSDKDYDTMYNTFQNTGNTIHSTKISSSAEGINNYYVRCKNINNQTMSYSEVISFNLIRKPTAVIELSKDPPLKSGTYEVTVNTNKEVQSITLSYSFNNDATQKTVFLSGSGKIWKGYMILEQGIGDSIGAFKLSAVDFNGNTGNIITKGELFLVDTTAPPSVSSLNAIPEKNGGITINWYYDGEIVKKFNIYRSNTEDVDRADYYESISPHAADEHMYEYIDNGVEYGITYYYRISAVDESDNEAELSDIVSVYSEPVIEVIDVPEKKMSPELLKKIDTQIQDIEKMILDLELRNSDIDKIEDPSKINIISMMGLNDKANQALDSLNSMRDELYSLKDEYMERSELDVRLNKIRLDSLKALSNVFEDIQVIEPGTYEQFTQESDVDNGVTLITQGMNITKKNMDNYSLSNKRIQDAVTVKVEVYPFRIKYLGIDDYQKFTIIKKTVSAESLSNVVILEIVPKEVERKASELIFYSNPPNIIKDDPVLSWDYSSLSNTEFYYVVKNNIDLATIKNTRTLVLLKPEFKFSDTVQEKDKLTGAVIASSISLSKLTPVHWMIIIGLGMIIVLSLYYFVVLDKKDVRVYDKNKRASHRIIKNLVNTVRFNNADVNNNLVVSNIEKNRLMNGKIRNINLSSSMDKNKASNDALRSNNSSINTFSSNTSSNDYNNGNNKNRNNALNSSFNNSFNSSVLLPEQVLLHKINYSNSLINSYDYESARNVFNQCITLYNTVSFDTIDDNKKAKDMLSHVQTKLESYRHIHSAKKQLYYKNQIALKNTLKKIDQLYSNLAYNICFIEHKKPQDEFKFLQFIANSKNQLEKYK